MKHQFTEQWNESQFVFEFYWDWNVRIDWLGRKPYGLTHEFWA